MRASLSQANETNDALTDALTDVLTSPIEYDPQQANISVWLSAAAFCSLNELTTKTFVGPLKGFIVNQTINDDFTDLNGFLGHLPSDKSIYVAFRGSTSFRDWVVNLDTFKTDYKLFPECECEVHKGFYEAIERVADKVVSNVKDLLNTFPEYSVKVTGHSLGAAMSQLFAMNLVKAGLDVSVYNFGQPRIGDEKYAEFVNKKLPNLIRVTHDRDTVPHIPFTFTMDFVHSCYEAFEDDQGNVRICDDSCEDSSCANQYKIYETRTSDHLVYLGLPLSCEAIS